MTPYLDACPNCRGYVEADTSADRLVLDLEHAGIGDVLQCTACQCWGYVAIDGGGKSVDWGMPCSSCLSHGIQSMLMALINHPRVEYAVVTVEE